MSKKHKSGNALAILVVVLTIGLLAAVGYIFYDKYIIAKNQTKDQNNNNINTSEDANALTMTAYDAHINSGVALKYPKNWIKTDSWDNANDRFVLTSPDNLVEVRFSSSKGSGLGGTCAAGPDDSYFVEVKKIDVDNIAGLTNARYADYILYNSYTNKYTYNAGAQQNTDYVNKVKLGDKSPLCDIFGVVSFYIVTVDGGQTDDSRMIQVKINLKNITAESTLSEINAALTSDSFGVAKKIVQSLYNK
jgi:hypothetical protein